MIRDWGLLVLRVLSPVVLYAFLGTIIYRLWKTGVPGSARLVAVDAPAQVWQLSPATVIGRDAASTVCVPDDFVSARHAEINFRDGKWWLADAGSTNGTFLNQNRMSVPVMLHSGDIITIGSRKFRFEQD